MTIPAIPPVCNAPNPEQLIRMVNSSADKIEQAIGQLSSSISAFAKGISIAGGLGFDVNFGDAIRNSLSSCPELFGLKQCLEGLLGDLEFGSDLGASLNIQAPCFNADIQDFIDIQFSCMKQAAEVLADQGITDPIGGDRRGQLDIPALAAVTNARYSRQDDKVLIEWNDNQNPADTIYTVSVFGVRITATLDKQFLLPGLTMGRDTDVVIKAHDKTLRFESEPVTLTVNAFDFRTPFDPTGVTIVGISLLEAILNWVASTFPNVIGYNLRWEDPDGTERVYGLGLRNEVAVGLGSLLPAVPTTVRITAVTRWDESDGVVFVVTPQAFAIDLSSFSPAGNPGVGMPQDFILVANQDFAPVGGWYEAKLTGVGPDIVLDPDTDLVVAGNTLTVSFTRPAPAYTDIEVRVWSQTGEVITVVEPLP